MEKLARNFSVQVTQIHEYTETKNVSLRTSRVTDNKFTVYGENSSFFWTVYGEREVFETEPLKINTLLKGSGPYKWI